MTGDAPGGVVDGARTLGAPTSPFICGICGLRMETGVADVATRGSGGLGTVSPIGPSTGGSRVRLALVMIGDTPMRPSIRTGPEAASELDDEGSSMGSGPRAGGTKYTDRSTFPGVQW